MLLLLWANSFVISSVRRRKSILVKLVVGLTALMAGPIAQAATRVEVPEDNQPIFYALTISTPIEPIGQHEEIHHNDEWAAIPFYRDPESVPEDFNLLEFFRLPPINGGSGFPADRRRCRVLGRVPPTPESKQAPTSLKYNGLGAVPIWFVSWPELQQAVADGQLTVPDLSSMQPRKGTASFYTENLYPAESADVPGYIAFASGFLEDGTGFKFHSAVANYEPVCCSSDHAEQFVHIEFNAIPEPSCMALLLLGLVGLTGYRRRRCLR